MSIAALAGAAYKMEINLARFYRRHLGRTLGGSHLPLLAGIEPPPAPGRHAVVSLDWWRRQLRGGGRPRPDHGRRDRGRQPRRRSRRPRRVASPASAFRELLAESPAPGPDPRGADGRADPPVAGHAAGGGLRIGEALADGGHLRSRGRLLPHPRRGPAALAPAARAPVDAARRATREEQAKLVPPLWSAR